MRNRIDGNIYYTSCGKLCYKRYRKERKTLLFR